MSWEPVANGIRTDHPAPNLPFVEDAHIPVEDPEQVEAIGRHAGTGMWGRYDLDAATGEWAAFTTDPKYNLFAWLVRYHPDHGRSVTVYRASDAASAYQDWFGDRPLLLRAGGYWWDGQTWYRPRQVLSYASEEYMRRPVRQPTALTAADFLDPSAQADRGQVHQILHLEPGPVPMQQWRHDLALWAQRQGQRPGALPLRECVITLTAPELMDSALLGVDEFAQEAGIAASTLRAYLSREEGDIPLPQVVDGSRKRWSRPVAQDWAERRRRDPGALASLLTGEQENSLSPGLRALWRKLADSFFMHWWDAAPMRRRWSRPHRNEVAVRDMAEHAGWIGALGLEQAVPFTDLSYVLADAALAELRDGTEVGPAIARVIPFNRPIGHVLGWFISHKPASAPALFGTIVREAERGLKIPPAVTQRSLTRAINMDGGIENSEETLREFFALAFPPEK
ncbi:hypothetical protein [Lentzea sp. NPDC055074]